MDQQYKNRENRARTTALRQGRTLLKIRRYAGDAPDWNRWLLFDGPGGKSKRDRSTGQITITGKLMISNKVRGIETGASLDEVEAALGIPPA